LPAEGASGPVLVTGATGFVGGALLRRLEGRPLIVLGRTPPAARGVTFLPADLAEPETIARHRDALGGVAAVVHLGAAMLRSSDPAADEMPHTLRVNVEGTARLLAALPSPLAAFCYASSVDVYGPPSTLPIGEDHPVRPASFYAVSKLATEHLLDVWAGRTGTPLAMLRLSQVYGPGDTSAKAIPSFVRAVLAGTVPRLAGNGGDTRDWVYVDDAVEAIVAALDRRARGTFNVAGGRGTSVREMLAIVQRLAGAPVDAAWPPARRPAMRIEIDVARARAELGWAPRVALDEGLRRTIAWFRDARVASA